MCYGRAYFHKWDEEQQLRELERLYCVRTYGAACVLKVWRTRLAVTFALDIIVFCWLRYYADLLLDIQAMTIFWKHGDYKFFWCNLSGVFLGLAWTALEMFRVLKSTPNSVLPREQVLLVGLILPLGGMHVTYLSVLSLWLGYTHPFLLIS